MKNLGTQYLNDFEKQASMAGKAAQYIIDEFAWSTDPRIFGCVYNGSIWIVYENDENGKPFNIQEFKHPLAAYKELAKRLNFQYIPFSDAQNIIRCKDCRYFRRKEIKNIVLKRCRKLKSKAFPLDENSFCAWVEKK